MSIERLARHSTVVGAGVFLAVLGTTIWLLAQGTRGAEVANVLVLPLTVAGLAMTLFGIQLRRDANDPRILAAAARAVAVRVSEQEAVVQQKILADTGDARAANVGFTPPDPAPIRWRTDGGDREGSLATIADFYDNLPRGRLVVIGEAGAGKTTLAIQMALDLARAWLARCNANGSQIEQQVPVRLSLPEFGLRFGEMLGPTPRVGEVTAALVRDRLDDWIAEQVSAMYGQRKMVARRLVAQGWILPILDGLDEMDADGVDPALARQAVRALNYPTGPSLRRVVVTCRSSRYGQLVSDPSATVVPDAIQDAAAVVMQPLTTAQVIQWLTHRFPDPGGPDGAERRWRPVIRRIRQHPIGALANCLSSPLRLYLAVMAYRDLNSYPSELLKINARDLDNHLFAHLIPAVTRQHRRPDGGRYSPDDVTRWLSTLADHLAWVSAHGKSRTDVSLPDLWRTSGDPQYQGRKVRVITTIAYASVTVAPLLAYSLSRALVGGQSSSADWLPWTRLTYGVGLVALVTLAATRDHYDLRRLNLAQVRTRAGRRRFADGVAGGLMITFTTGLALELVRGLAIGVDLRVSFLNATLVAITLGPAVALVVGLLCLHSRPVVVDRPSQVMNQALTFDAVIVSASGLLAGLVFGTYFLSAREFGLWITFGLIIGLMLRVWSPWPRYAITALTMSRTGQLPIRLGAFLDWAYGAGLLRLSGIAIQFRHREFQEWLNAKRLDYAVSLRRFPESP